MADDNAKARFKSKWNRVFKEKEEGELNPKHTNSFKLNDDVADFLKPSTDRAAASSTRAPTLAPKLDIAIAQRWPDAHSVKSARTMTPSAQQNVLSPNGFTKPPRRPGLSVGFAKTAPEVIGEGGDESEEPPSEIGRLRAMMPRSVSVAKPQVPASRQGSIQAGGDDDFTPMPLRRAQTSHNEFSPAVQKKQSTPVQQSDSFSPRKLSRTPTGFSSQDEQDHLPTHGDDEPPMPSLDANLRQLRKVGTGLEGKDQKTLSARTKGLRSEEGMALRRASAMIMTTDDNEDEEQKRQSFGFGVQPPAQHYETLSRPDAESLMPEPSTLSPRSAVSPRGPSPFDDPKYVSRPSQEEVPNAQQPPPPQSLRAQRPAYQPSYMRAAQQQTSPESAASNRSAPQTLLMQSANSTQSSQTSPENPAQSLGRGTHRDDQPSYMRSMPPSQPEYSNTRPRSSSSQNMNVPQQTLQGREPSPMRDRLLGQNLPSNQAAPLYARPNGSNTSLNRFPPPSHSRTSSRDGSPQAYYSANSGSLSSPSATVQSYGDSPQSGSPRSATRPFAAYAQQADVQRTAGSSGSQQRPTINFSAPRVPQIQQPKAPPSGLRQHEDSPDSAGPIHRQADNFYSQKAPSQASFTQVPASSETPPERLRSDTLRSTTSVSSGRPGISPQPTSEGNPAADAAYADFAARVAHMKGVFRLTAEKEQPAERCSPIAWLRTALWWYLRAKAGLEVLLQQRPRSPNNQPRELLTQPHVDLAKTWWILSDPLAQFDSAGDVRMPNDSSGDNSSEVVLRQSTTALKGHIRSLTLSMGRSQLMPPPQSLIQGQNTRIWVEYPRFTSDAAAVLGGETSRSAVLEQSMSVTRPIAALPLGDTKDAFCYGRFLVDVSINTNEAESDRVSMPCILSMLRDKRDFLTTVIIASQNELVNVKIGPRQGNERGLTWGDVSWKTSSYAMTVQLPRNFGLTVRMHERDFRSLWNLSEYARKVESSIRAEKDERLVHDVQLAEMQYADSSNSNAFPSEKVRGTTALVFERTKVVADGGGEYRVHRGYRLLLVTDPTVKSLACASHEIGRRAPLCFEFLTDTAANGMAAMVIRIRDDATQCRILLVFSNAASRQTFYDVLNGVAVGQDETIVGKMSLTSMNIEPATQTAGFTQEPHPALRSLQWQKLGITSGMSDDPNNRIPSTVRSPNLRIVARHTTGCITDRMNLGKGELLVRLPCRDTSTIQILRNPQEDMIMSIDIRNSHPSVSDSIGEVFQTLQQQPTIRTFAFASPEDLHNFQTAITGYTVRYNGLASVLSIARRRMVVPIYKKWEANNVRLQIVSRDTVVQVLAFMEDFSHTDAMCFQVKSMDTFEMVKGDGKSKKWAVKMVDAKFSLPHIQENHKEDGPETEDLSDRVRRRFVNLEGLDYAEEHDDVTVGFDTQEDRDRFAQALPAAATVGRGITLKRRI